MNFKTNVLKLFIMLMLILVLIPAVAAEGVDESFYIEYVDDGSSEAIVEESISTDITEYDQQDASFSSNFAEVDAGSEVSDIEYSGGFTTQSNSINQSDVMIEDGCDEVLILEQEDSPVLKAQDILEETENDSITIFYDEIISDTDYSDIYETCDEELTVEDTSVIKQDSLFNLKHDNNIYLTSNGIYNNATSNYGTSGLKRSSFKVLELKNNLLINHDIKNVFSEDIFIGLDGDAIVCINKATTDFMFSIDNSVICDEKLIFLACSFSCFNLIPSFDAFSDFLDVDCLLGVYTKYFHDSFLFHSCFNINIFYGSFSSSNLFRE